MSPEELFSGFWVSTVYGTYDFGEVAHEGVDVGASVCEAAVSVAGVWVVGANVLVIGGDSFPLTDTEDAGFGASLGCVV